MNKTKQSFHVLGAGLAFAVIMGNTHIGTWGLGSLVYAFLIFAATMVASNLMFYRAFCDPESNQHSKRIAMSFAVLTGLAAGGCLVIVLVFLSR
jgi:hypothetical protein